MQTNPSPVWKTVLKGIPWFVGILVYGVLITIVSLIAYQGHGEISHFNFFFAGGLWIALLALPGGILIEHNHKTIGWVLVGMALMVLVLFITGALLIAGAYRPDSGYHPFGGR